MSILGMLYPFYVAGMFAKDGYERSKMNEQSLSDARRDRCETYLFKTSSGWEQRLTSNNHRSESRMLTNGDRVLYDIDSKVVVRNYSAEQRAENSYINEAKKKEAENEGKTVYLVDRDGHENFYIYDPQSRRSVCDVYGMRYKDFKTGQIYVIRCVNDKKSYGPYVYYYMNVSTGMFVRKTDGQIEIDKKFLKKNEITRDEYYTNRGEHIPTVDELNRIQLQKKPYMYQSLISQRDFWLNENICTYRDGERGGDVNPFRYGV